MNATTTTLSAGPRYVAASPPPAAPAPMTPPPSAAQQADSFARSGVAIAMYCPTPPKKKKSERDHAASRKKVSALDLLVSACKEAHAE